MIKDWYILKREGVFRKEYSSLQTYIKSIVAYMSVFKREIALVAFCTYRLGYHHHHILYISVK